MAQVFLRLVQISFAAGWMVLAAVVLRLLMKKAPRRIVCLLWALVALRLLCPVQITWRASLMPPQETVVQAAQTTLSTPGQAASAATEPAAPSAAPDRTALLSRVWLAGVSGMLLWAAISDVRLRRRLRASVPQQDGVRICDEIDTPFVLGLFRPRIYLPSGLDPSQCDYVLAHERAHIARGDPWWKALGWLLLCVYWFQPLLWLAYVLMCRDLELACDERVARDLDRPGLAAYAETLLECGCRRRSKSIVPVAFAEVGVKTRVRAILHYQKSTILRAVIALALVAAAGAFLLTERPVRALQLPEQIPAAEESAVTPPKEQEAPLPGEVPHRHTEDAPTPSAAPQAQAAASTSQTQTYTGTAQTQTSAGTAAYDPQAEIDEYIRQMNEEYARKNQEAAAKNGATGSSLRDQPSSPVPDTPAPVVLIPGADSSGSIGPTDPTSVVIQNGGVTAIRLYP